MIKPAILGTHPKEIQLSTILDNNLASGVLKASEKLFEASWKRSDFRAVLRAFRLARNLYSGNFPGYQACSTDYHDWHHILDVTIASARLLDGAMLGGRAYTAEEGADLLIAAILHDAGYILETDDRTGTGAKYTTTHVDRSAAFALRHAQALGLEPSRARRIARLILGTDMGRKWAELEFSSTQENELAAILAAADLLGQMGDRTYLEKLLFLYYEFREAGFGGYDSAYAILEKTLGFYDIVKARLDSTLASTAGLSQRHFAKRHGVDRDLYREAVDRQMDYLAGVVADDSCNFRTKLKRLDLEAIERARAGHPA